MGDSANPNIQWVEGSGKQLKPGFSNWLASLFGGGEYANSLGENVMLVQGRPFGEGVNEATFTLFLASNTEGPSAILNGNTVPANQNQYGTIVSGIYSTQYVAEYGSSGLPALLLEGGGDIPVMFGNPNNPDNAIRPTSQHIADEIFFHIGNTARLSLTTRAGNPISEGCLTGSHANVHAYRNFMNNLNSKNSPNIYLLRTYNAQPW